MRSRRPLVLMMILTFGALCWPQEHQQYSAKEQGARIIAAREPQANKQQIIAYEKSLLEAEKRHDWPTIAQRLAPEFVEIAGDGNAYTKADVEKYFPEVKLIEYELSDIQFLALGATAALLMYKADVNFTFQGKPGPAHMRVSTAWVQDPTSGQWLVMFHQATLVPQPAGSK